MQCIKDTDNGEKSTRKVKQRSAVWFESRKAMKITGSTIFTAIGLDGLKRQKDHFDSVVCGVERTTNEKEKNALEY